MDTNCVEVEDENAIDQNGLNIDQVPVVALPCDPLGESSSVSFVVCDGEVEEQQCDLKDGQVQDDGEVLLVQGLQDFQGVVSTETVVVDDCSSGMGGASANGITPFQQYQPVVVQGFVTSSGEVVHVVQQDTPPNGGHRVVTSQPQTYQQPYQQPAMHPDLYRLIKMFPDFSPKTLHRIFVMCHCDLKRALDQALFARQFRQLDSAPSYSPVAPSAASAHFHPGPYRSPRQPYMQMGVDFGSSDVYLHRGLGRPPHAAPPQPPLLQSSQHPILLYQQAQQADPRLAKQASINTLVQQDVDDAEVVHISLPSDGHNPVSLADDLGLLAGGVMDGALEVPGDPGGDNLEQCSKASIKGPETDLKSELPDLTDAAMKDTECIEVVTSQATIVS